MNLRFFGFVSNLQLCFTDGLDTATLDFFYQKLILLCRGAKYVAHFKCLANIIIPGTQVYFELDRDANRIALQVINAGLQKNKWHFWDLPVLFGGPHVRAAFLYVTGAIRILDM